MLICRILWINHVHSPTCWHNLVHSQIEQFNCVIPCTCQHVVHVCQEISEKEAYSNCIAVSNSPTCRCCFDGPMSWNSNIHWFPKCFIVKLSLFDKGLVCSVAFLQCWGSLRRNSKRLLSNAVGRDCLL